MELERSKNKYLNKCRFCLKISGNNMISIFKKELQIVDMFDTCFGLTISNNSELPNFLCKHCYQQLKQSYKFYKECLKSMEILMIAISSDAEDSLKTTTECIANVNNENYIKQIESQNNKEMKITLIKDEYSDFTDTIKISNVISLSDNINQQIVTPKSEEQNSIQEPDKIKKLKKKSKKLTTSKKVCPICGILSANFKRHLVQHSTIKPYECDICGKRCSDKANIQRHLDIHTNTRRFRCKECLQTFVDPTSLRTHMTKHTGERKYNCQYCDKTFRQLSSRNVHHLSHTQIRNYKCEICNKSFLRSTHLKRHIMIHTGERPYQCEICNLSFGQSSTLKTHSKIHNR